MPGGGGVGAPGRGVAGRQRQVPGGEHQALPQPRVRRPHPAHRGRECDRTGGGGGCLPSSGGSRATCVRFGGAQCNKVICRNCNQDFCWNCLRYPFQSVHDYPRQVRRGARRGCCHCFTAFARPGAGVELQHGARSVQVHRRGARDEGAAAPPPIRTRRSPTPSPPHPPCRCLRGTLSARVRAAPCRVPRREHAPTPLPPSR
jgi:hypothetical protein